MDQQKERLNEILTGTLYDWEVDCQPETIAQMTEHLLENDVTIQKHGKWLFIREPNMVDTCGNPVYHAQCSECGFKWTELYAVRKYFKGCPSCTAKMECPSVFEVWKDCELGQTYKVHTFYTKPDADEWINQNERYYPGWHLRIVEVKE